MNNLAVLKSDEPVGQPFDVHPEDSRQHRHGAASKQGSPGKRERHLLTAREGTIIAFIGSGRSNKEIARELGVTPETIKSHLKRIFLKLSVSTRAQAVVQAQCTGLVELRIGDNPLMHQTHQ